MVLRESQSDPGIAQRGILHELQFGRWSLDNGREACRCAAHNGSACFHQCCMPAQSSPSAPPTGSSGSTLFSSICSGESANAHAYCDSAFLPSRVELERCLAGLQRDSLWPGQNELGAAARWFNTSAAAMFIGDSTIENKAFYLFHPLGVRSACRDGPGVCLAAFAPIAPRCTHEEWRPERASNSRVLKHRGAPREPVGGGCAALRASNKERARRAA